MSMIFAAADVNRIIEDYHKLFGFDVQFRDDTRIVLVNSYLKLIFLDNRYDLDVFISNTNETNKVHLESLVEFLCPDFVFEGPRYNGGLNFDSLIKGCLKEVLITGNLNWADVLSHENRKSAVRKYIVENYPPGHELIYLMNSGNHWLKKVQGYLDKHGITINREPER